MFIGTIKTLDLDDVTSNRPENEAPVYDAATTYDIADEVIYNHAIYGCLVDGTLGKQPDTHSSRFQTPQYWQLKGPTNAFAAVDGVLSVATKNDSGGVAFIFTNISNIAGVGIFNAIGETASAVYFDINDDPISSETINLSGFNLNSYYDWLFTQPSSGNTNYIFRNIPVSCRRVRVSVLGGPTALGEVSIIEDGYDIGRALFGSKINVKSRSIYQDDEFGIPRYVQRPSRVNATFEVFGERDFIEALWGRLRDLSGLRVVYEAQEDRTITTGAGIVRGISVPINLPNGYLFSIEIEGVQ